MLAPVTSLANGLEGAACLARNAVERIAPPSLRAKCSHHVKQQLHGGTGSVAEAKAVESELCTSLPENQPSAEL